MKTTIKWVIAVFLILSAIGSLANSQYLTGIGFTLMALLVSPPFIPFFEKKTGYVTPRPVRYIAFFALWLFSVLFYDRQKIETPLAATPSNQTPEVNEKPIETAIEKTALEKLQDEYSYFKNNFKVSDFRGSTQQVVGETMAFGLWATAVNKGLADSNQQVVALATKFKKELVAFQLKEFPSMRASVSEELRKTLWEEDIDVSVQGKGKTVLNLTSSSFVTNKNIKAAQDVIYAQLYNLRFKEVRYRWYNGADEYQFFKLESPSDSELVDAHLLLQ
jgi:hypothetical protein